MLPLPSSTKLIEVTSFADLYPYRAGSIKRSGPPCRSVRGLPAISRTNITRGDTICSRVKYSYHLSAQSTRIARAVFFGFTISIRWPKRKPPQSVRDDQHCTHFIREL